jgi:putative phosphoesterase
VISDTHGLLRPQALDALSGSDLILHAGDVGDPGILARLAGIAPVRAVHGNTDHGELHRLPETDVIDLIDPDGDFSGEAPGPIAYLLHQLELLDLDPAAAGFSVVAHGHTHEPAIETRDGVLYFNPGAAGHRRFRLPVTVGRLRVEKSRIHPEIVHLDVGTG